MKATEINDLTICKTNADWILHQINELRALLSYKSENMIVSNKTRALSALDCIKNSAEEMRLYMNNTKVYFLNEEKKVSWHFADIITVQNRQYGFTTHESGKFTAYDVLSGEKIGMFEHLIEFMDRINEPKFEEILESDKYEKTCLELDQALCYFRE